MLSLSTDRPRISHQSANESKNPIILDASLTQSLKNLAVKHNMDLSTIVISGWGAVLARLSSQDDILIGYYIDSPTRPGDNQTDNSTVSLLRLDLSGEPNISQLLERVRKMASSSMDHRDFPQDSRSEITGSPLLQVALRWSQAPIHHATQIQVELELQLQEQDNGVVGSMAFCPDLFNPETVERHVGYLRSMLQAIATDVDKPVMSVDLLSQAEQDLVLEKWNGTQRDYPDHLCIHQLIEQQVERTPHATALVFDDQSLTYRELNERANKLAHHLLSLGVQSDSLVAICVECSFAMIERLLAILKAGGAYVPLDPSYSRERLRDILMDASPSILIADNHGKDALGEAILFSVTVMDPNIMEADSDSKR
jgi:non-ribosomal peptide synthetase component F